MGSEYIDLSLKNIWHSWFAFRKGKRPTPELHIFQYHLEKNLYGLFQDLSYGNYHHGSYRKFIVNDNKRRKISVAPIRDRIVHRLLYDYLLPIWDKTFIYDVWSCRKEKGLLAAIERIQKFFDNVDHDILLKNLARRISHPKAMDLLRIEFARQK